MNNTTMKYEEIKSLSSDALRSKIATEEGNLQTLRFAHAISALENPMQIKHTKKLIAKLKTAQNNLETPKN